MATHVCAGGGQIADQVLARELREGTTTVHLPPRVGRLLAQEPDLTERARNHVRLRRSIT